MTGVEILSLLSKGVMSGAISYITRKGIEGVVEWVKENSHKKGFAYRIEDGKQIRELFQGDKSFQNIILAQCKFTNRKGIAIVGPSGAGKTALWNYLTGKKEITPLASSFEREYQTARFDARYIRVTDTPGSPFQVDLRHQTYDYIQRGKIDILIVMLAYGYLDTVGISGLWRPGKERNKSTTLERYLEEARQEEQEWLEDFVNRIPDVKQKIPYCMVVINKMDQWYDDNKIVSKYYTKRNVKKQINLIVKKFCCPDRTASFHYIACSYNSFKGHSPSGEVSLESALFSLAVLRGEIARRLKEID